MAKEREEVLVDEGARDMGADAGPHSRFLPVGRMKRKVWGDIALTLTRVDQTQRYRIFLERVEDDGLNQWYPKKV